MYGHFVVRYIITQMADNNNIEINSGNKNKDFYMKIYVHIRPKKKISVFGVTWPKKRGSVGRLFFFFFFFF